MYEKTKGNKITYFVRFRWLKIIITYMNNNVKRLFTNTYNNNNRFNLYFNIS